MSRKEFQRMFVDASTLPTKKDVWERVEAIDADSLSDAFEVENDGIEGIFNRLMGW